MEDVLVERAPVRLRRPARLLRLASDERLVALVRAGDESAFEALYDRHHPAILGFCRHMLGVREEAEDAVQHTFLAAYRDLVASEKPIELRAWLFAIARNRCISLLRARRAHVAIELAEPASDGLTATVERREDLRELLADLARLPEDQRAALLLAELGALDHAGIATVLGCPREKVKALVFQARTSLAASREARATPCDEIRLELATASGAALRRGPLRRHLRTCDGCRAFKAEVATQRKLLALALPVVPSIALKASVLSAGGGAQASGGAAVAASATTAGATSGASGGALGGVLGTVASTGAGKIAVSLAVASAVASGGALTERIARHAAPPSRTPSLGGAVPGADAPSLHAAPAGRPTGGVPLSDPGGLTDPTARLQERPPTANGGNASDGATAPYDPPSPHPRDGDATSGGAPGADHAPSHTPAAAPAEPAPAGGGVRSGGATPPTPAPTPVPTPTPAPPAQGNAPGSTPPAPGRASPPAPPSRAPEDPRGGNAPSAIPAQPQAESRRPASGQPVPAPGVQTPGKLPLRR
ncbi:MAG: sigma-70 family RNA polymerase sigma factor [Conexibacter sp.]